MFVSDIVQSVTEAANAEALKSKTQIKIAQINLLIARITSYLSTPTK